ncbi:MAG: NAD(+) diphosphatase [Myxococcales bacterium]|nr:NAD(+) diphosphatase [Myxococcales bacterium]
MDSDLMTFAGEPLDRADARRRDETWLSEQLRGEAPALPVWQGKPWIVLDGGVARPAWVPAGRLQALVDAGAQAVLLGIDSGGRPRFAVDVSALADPRGDGPLVGEGKPIDLRSIAPSLDPGDAGTLAQARSLLEWHAAHPRCARCGAPTRAQDGGYRRRCDACQADHFPRTDPVVIMLVCRGDRCLLGRKPTFPPGLFTCLAGFIEPGETIEAAVRREVREESGVVVGRVRYVASQPWPFPSQLMIGCEAEALTDAIDTDDDELEEARWIPRDRARALIDGVDPDGLFVPPPSAIAHHLIRGWARGES